LELSEIAERTGLASLHREVLLDRIPALERGKITLVVLGEFNHGKSTVVNALLGEDVLPVGITPTTAVITHLVHGDERTVRVKPARDDKAFPIEYDEMEDVVKHAEDDGNEPDWVEIAHPNEFLANSLTLVDTPGVNDISRQKVEITYGYLPRADVIVYVLDATQVLKKSEVVFIKDRLLKANRDRIIFVLNKIDALNEDDAKEVELYARERLEGLIGEVELYAFSGRAALEATTSGTAPAQAFLDFRDYLIGFLDDQRGYIIIDSALAGGLRVAALLEQNLAIKRQGYLLEAKELDKRIDAVQAKLHESRRLIADNLELIDERTKGIAATAKNNLRTFRDGFLEALPIEIERADAREVKRYLPQFIQDTFKDWLEREGAEVARNLEELAEEVIEITNQNLQDTVEALRQELGLSKDLDLDVDTIAYDVGVFALGAFGVSIFLFANALVGGLLTLAAPVLAFFLRDKVDSKLKERAREEGQKAIEQASAQVEIELLRVIHEYGDSLKAFVENAGDRLYSQVEEVLEQIQKERAANETQEDLLANVETSLDAVRRVGRVLKKSRERLAEAAAST
jgi:small GTP-binding protein